MPALDRGVAQLVGGIAWRPWSSNTRNPLGFMPPEFRRPIFEIRRRKRQRLLNVLSLEFGSGANSQILGALG